MTRDMRLLDLAELRQVAAEHPYPLLFATVSGAHLYGFPSQDSDVDLRGAHLLAVEDLVGLRAGPDTIDRTWQRADAEIDLVTHDAAKFFRLLLRPNGYGTSLALARLANSGAAVARLLDPATGRDVTAAPTFFARS